MKNYILKLKIGYFCLLVAFFSVLFFAFNSPGANAATLYFSPSSGNFTVGNIFTVSVLTNTQDEAINNADAIINFPSALLEIVSISKSGSIFSLWVEEPAFSNGAGTVSFNGGVPTPGFNGASGKIISIVFRAKSAGAASVIFSSGAVRANDGFGTNVLKARSEAKFSLIQEEEVTPKAPAAPTAPAEVVSAPGAPKISSPTHPDQTVWYSNNKATFKWEIPYGTTGVSILLDDKPASNPGPTSDGLFSTRDYEDLGDGISYLHLKLKDKSDWSEIGNFKVLVDTTPPLPFEVILDREEGTTEQVLRFETTDATSGIDRYEVKIGNQDFVVKPEDGSLKAPSLPAGKYTAIVKAIDKAGNETLAFADFTIEPIEAPVIKNYPRELRPSDQLFILGTAVPDVTIDVFVQNRKTEEIIKQTVESDKNGNWVMIYEEGLANGRYFAWAEAINSQGIKSSSSNKVSFLVTSPIFVKFGSWAINYFTIFILLLIFLILVVALLAYWAGLIRGRLKKETDEVQQVLHGNLKEFRKLIEKESAYLESIKGKAGYGKERIRMGKVLKGRIDFIEKKIGKEIKDVQDLLK